MGCHGAMMFPRFFVLVVLRLSAGEAYDVFGGSTLSW